MKLGKLRNVSAPRRAWKRPFGTMGVAVAVGVFGLAGVRPTEGRADAAAADGSATDRPVRPPEQWARDWPAVTAADLELPVPPPFPATPPHPTTTTAAAAVETTPPPAPPVETKPTTVAPPPPAPPTAAPPTTAPPTTAPPAPPRPASTGPQAQARVEAIADSAGWDWRAAGVRFRLGFYPGDCCHWGVYESAKSIIWLGPTAFADPNRLRYVVLHELAHAWQYRQNRFADFISDYSAWGFTTIGPALEAGADCLANVWGAAGAHYWRCTSDARALASRRLGGDWR